VPSSEATQARVNRLQAAAVNLGEHAHACVPSSLPAALGSASRAAAEVKAQLSAAGSRVRRGAGILHRTSSDDPLCSPREMHREGPFPREPGGQVVWTSSRSRDTVRPPGYRASEGTVVILHVYDALWVATANTKMPVVHLGVEVYGNEFSYGETGLKSVKPGLYDERRHRSKFAIGRTHLGKREVYKLVIDLKKDWPGESYKLVGNNCQTFALEFCKTLGVSEGSIPSQYVYFAEGSLGNLVPLGILLNSGSNSGSRSSGWKSSNCFKSSSDFEELAAENTGLSEDQPPTLPRTVDRI